MSENGLHVTRADHPSHTPEAELMVVDTGTPGVVRLVLDDGTEIVAERRALIDALELAQQEAA